MCQNKLHTTQQGLNEKKKNNWTYGHYEQCCADGIFTKITSEVKHVDVTTAADAVASNDGR